LKIGDLRSAAFSDLGALLVLLRLHALGVKERLRLLGLFEATSAAIL
jgi:hypothetical protein